MTREKLSKLIKHPKHSEPELIPALEEIVARYPFYTNGHLLLTLQYRQLDHIKFESQLRRTAVHVPDRAVLRKLILWEDEPEEIHASVEMPLMAVAHEQIQEVIPADHSLSVPIETPPLETPKLEKLDPREVIEQRLQELKQQEQLVREKLIEETGLEKPILVPIKKFEEHITPHEKTEIIPEVIEPVKMDQKTVTELSPLALKEDNDNNITEPPPQSTTETDHKKDGKRSFNEWINLSLTKPKPIQPPVTLTPSIDYFALETTIKTPVVVNSNSEKPQTSLIDKFIREEPRIVPSKSEFYSPGNMARKSAQEHEDLISETLARIYAQQGNIDKAISTYERLALKLPQKKPYFASLIKKLKGEE